MGFFDCFGGGEVDVGFGFVRELNDGGVGVGLGDGV